MKIESIAITKLFGTFDHTIPLNNSDHITIIHGPNGYGKTILLTLVNALFKSNFYELKKIPFQDMTICFDNGDRLKVINSFDKKNKAKEKKSTEELVIEYYSKNKSEPQRHTIEAINRKLLSFPLSLIEHTIDGLDPVGPETWYHTPSAETLSLDEVIYRFGDRFPSRYRTKEEPKWLRTLPDSINIKFVETQRLQHISKEKAARTYKYDSHAPTKPAVNQYSHKLASAIQKKLAEYGSLSQSLDRTFPTRLFEKQATNGSTLEKLKEQLKELEEKRDRLVDAGFLDKDQDIDFKDLPQKIDKNNIAVLSVYVKDNKEKLRVFDELTDRIDLFIKIINGLFLFKKLSINKKEGFIFKSPTGAQIPLTSLSSGEQHEIVLLYEMLFEVQPNTLILMDEPELSLHVVWQRKFLEDLQEITRVAGFDVLIATHSPQIINDRWDLTIELEGPSSEE